MKRNGLTIQVLKFLSEAPMITAELIEVLMTSPYGSSVQTLRRKSLEIEKRRRLKTRSEIDRRRYHDLLYRLCRDGLVAKEKNSKRWVLTTTGKKFWRDS